MRQLEPALGPVKAAVDDIVYLLFGPDHPIEQHLVRLRLVELTPDSVQHQPASAIERIEADIEELTVFFCLLALIDDFEGKVVFSRQPPSLLTDALRIDVLAEVLVEVILDRPEGH
jgi:hypothetical protein